MASYINEHGKLVLTGDDAVKGFLYALKQLRENRKLHYKTTFQDLPISIENRKGSIRRGEDQDGDEWETKMKVPYGYIQGTEGVDGDALDTFIGPDENVAYAYIVHCNTPDGGAFDEDKVMLGFSSEEQARRCFNQHYDDPAFFGGIDTIPMWKFRQKIWTKKYTTKKLVASRAGASLQVPEDMLERIDTFGRGTDQDMKKSILGHHQDIMVNPKVREHGVQGQKWGVVNPRKDTGKPRPKPDLQNDPRTMNMMQVVKRSQPQLNAIRVWQKNRAARLAAQGQKPPSQQQHHEEALSKLKELGWKALEVGSRLTGTENALGIVKSIIKAPSGEKAVVSTDKQGNHKITPSGSRKRRTKTSRVFESRMGRFLREANKTYYARSLGRYGSDAEESDIDMIKESFGGGVNSPATKRHAELGMGYFHKKVDAAKRVVIKPVQKRRLTAGVFSEAKHALKKKIPVYAIYKGKMRRVKNVEALNNPNKHGHFGRIIFKKKKK